jgi:hypothetical protein
MKETKELVCFLVDIMNWLGKSFEDGDISLSDLLALLPKFKEAGAAINGIEKIPSELKHVPEYELAALYKHIQDHFDIPQDNIEMVAETLIKVALQLVLVFRTVKTKKA